MILRLFRRTSQGDTIAALYGAIVAQARLPIFYSGYQVPDTVNGRFEMIVLHAALLLGRLDGEQEPERKLGQAIFDRFCSDMDATMREMGVGDLAIPRKMRAVAEAFYGRKRAYETAMAESEGAKLAAALLRNVYGSAADAASGAERLAGYSRLTAKQLAVQDLEMVRQGCPGFPDPTDIPGNGRGI
jgi:cytochrome b pre-mRNA-processing protein 3